MLKHYLNLSWKALIKNRFYTTVNVLGLVLGMLSSLVIAKYVGASLHLDDFHQYKNSIYSVNQEEFVNGNPQEPRNATYWGVAQLAGEFSEVGGFTRYFQHVESLVIAEGKTRQRVSFIENNIFIADSSFFRIFTFPFIHGHQEEALSKRNSIVLTKRTSQKYFGESNPVGKTVTMRLPWGGETTYEVSGVVDDISSQSRFKFDFLVAHYQPEPDEFWNVPDYSTFLLVKENANAGLLADRLTEALQQVPKLKAGDRKITLSLEPIASPPFSDIERILVAIGIFVTVISWVNYINQIIAQSFWRTKEVGILRVMGATKVNLNIQFFIESGIVCITSLILVFVLYAGLDQYLRSFTGDHLLPLFDDPTPINSILIGIFVTGIIIASWVPTAILVSRNFGATLRNVYSTKVSGVGLRKALVVVQFSISTVLLISLFVITSQLKFTSTKHKGFNMEDILIVKAPLVKDTTWQAKIKTLELFKERCATLPFVTAITSSTTVPGEEYRHETYLSLRGQNTKALVHQNGVDEHFFTLYGIEFVSGNGFIPNARAKNRGSIVINESAARALGISDVHNAINGTIIDHEETGLSYDLIGIIKDFHQTSLKYEMRPMAFKFNVSRGHCSLKVARAASSDPGFLENATSSIKEIWDLTYPDTAFDIFFLKTRFEAQDIEDRYLGTLLKYFTALSVVLSSLGLFGLSLLISTKRQKEVGVRKVFGATTSDILATFLKGYATPLILSVLIGGPVAYLMMNTWLNNYAYRILIGPSLALPAILTLTAIFLCTISYHTIRSSLSNPVDVLKQ